MRSQVQKPQGVVWFDLFFWYGSQQRPTKGCLLLSDSTKTQKGCLFVVGSRKSPTRVRLFLPMGQRDTQKSVCLIGYVSGQVYNPSGSRLSRPIWDSMWIYVFDLFVLAYFQLIL